jgi:hypothetical protein
MARHISSEILIDRPPEVVWKILNDLDEFKDWNPFIVNAEGKVTKGAHLTLTTKADTKAFTLKPTVTEYVPTERFSWMGHLGGMPGIFTGKHHHQLMATAQGTRYIQSEDFSGMLVPFVGKAIKDTEAAFGRMNLALKERAEAIPQTNA